MILALWIGVYPKPFLEYIQQPVNAVVKQVRPDYVIPGQKEEPQFSRIR
jgi:NADH:ubiquinone oxidoreductase subunit 4 (subunit M)